MKSLRAAILPGLMGALGVLGARASLAADPACARTVVDADAGVRARWPEWPQGISEAFAARDDIDPCARVSLTLRGDVTVVGVALPDGRFASRSVSRPEDLIPTLEALLLLPRWQLQASAAPDVPAAPVAVAAATRREESDADARASVAVSHHDTMTIAPASQASRLRIDLSLVMGARMGDGHAGVGLGVLSFVEIAGWLAGFEGRVDGYQGISAGPATGALELAVLGGRRFRSGTLALDLLAGPALALQGGTKSVMQVGSTGPAVNSSFSTVDPRLQLGVHLTLRANSTLRTFFGIEGEFGLAGVAADRPKDLPPLPGWTVGLALGATVGTR